MSKCYVVYESYSLDCKNINDEKYRERILKVFADKNCIRTAQYILDRVKEQCDIVIDPNEKYLKETEKVVIFGRADFLKTTKKICL